MFGTSLPEIVLIALVGLLVLGPKEFLAAVKSLRKAAVGIKKWYDEFSRYLSSELASLEDDDYIDIIFDEKGKPRKTYDVKLSRSDKKNKDISV